MVLSHYDSVLGSCFAALHCNSRNCSQAATCFCLRPQIDRIMAGQNHAERYSRSAAPSMILSRHNSVLGGGFARLWSLCLFAAILFPAAACAQETTPPSLQYSNTPPLQYSNAPSLQ